MKRNNSFLLLTIALLLAFGAAWLANDWIFNLESHAQSRNDIETVPVVVATLKIPYGQIVKENSVKLQPIPVSLVTDDHFTTIEELDGLVTNGDVFPGEILNRQRVTDKALGAVLASLISRDMRAVTVRVNDVIGVAGFLLPNNRVDVLASRKQDKRSEVSTVLQNVKVLAVDQTAAPKSKESNAVVVRAVTLEVTPDQAETLYKAIQEGGIQLALRNPKDEYIIPPPPVPIVVQAEPPKLVEPKPTPKIVARAAPTSYLVTVIRGTSSTRQKFNN
jgi:pilus assembly protein CpaB